MCFGFLCAEGVGHNIGIILVNFPNLALITSIMYFSANAMYCNYFILVKDLPRIFQYVSDWAFPKFIFNSALIIIYGLNRCPPEEQSIILHKFDIKGEELNDNIIKLAIFASVLRVLAFFMLYLKTNLSFDFKSKTKTNESIEMNANNSSVVEFNKIKKRLSLILHEIYSVLEQIGSDFNGVKCDNITERPIKELAFACTQLTLRIPKTAFIEEKVILKEINVFFEFRTINALMGSSGAGKTSLLKAINGLYCDYITNNSNLYLNKCQRIRTCFVVQDVREHILMGLTAGEAMTYASKLKNSDPNYDHKKNVKKLMDELLIRNTIDTNVENCSGGEQKRLVIAMELTSHFQPNLLCIDEPTSGLDSNAAEVVSH